MEFQPTTNQDFDFQLIKKSHENSFDFIISLVTNVRCCTGNQFFCEAPGSGIKGRPAPEVATDAPQARLVLTSNFMGFGCFFAMDLSSKSLAQDRK